MKIATFNIYWAKKYKSEKTKAQKTFSKIEDFLNKQDFDFLILTEAIDLNLEKFPFRYFSENIPEHIEYEELNYSDYLNGEKAFRTAIYSKTKAVKKYDVADRYTNLALEFETEFGNVVFLATIIGTWFSQKPKYAKAELINLIKDSKKIIEQNKNLFIVGDLNTSFKLNEKKTQINKKISESITYLFEELHLYNATQNIEENVDHIIVPYFLSDKIIESNFFIKKDELSDHKGIFITLQKTSSNIPSANSRI